MNKFIINCASYGLGFAYCFASRYVKQDAFDHMVSASLCGIFGVAGIYMSYEHTVKAVRLIKKPAEVALAVAEQSI